MLFLCFVCVCRVEFTGYVYTYRRSLCILKKKVILYINNTPKEKKKKEEVKKEEVKKEEEEKKKNEEEKEEKEDRRRRKKKKRKKKEAGRTPARLTNNDSRARGFRGKLLTNKPAGRALVDCW